MGSPGGCVTGRGHPRDAGLLAGAVTLLLGFLVTLPLVAADSAIFVQLQISRVFWLLDLLGTLVLVGVLVDSPATPAARRWRPIVAGLVMAAAVGRRIFVAGVEQRDRPVIALTLPESDWTHVVRWVATQPAGTCVARGSGACVEVRRAAPLQRAGRLYGRRSGRCPRHDRGSADRVIARQAALGPFDTLDAAHARVARRAALDFLVVDRDMDLPSSTAKGRSDLRLAGPPGRVSAAPLPDRPHSP
ncbi:MAG: hypothetical protein R2712_01910 [Vicinamibacterales bacterium]